MSREAALKIILEWANKKEHYGNYHRSKTAEDLLNSKPSNCSDRDRLPSNVEKIDEKTVRMKVKKNKE